MGVSTSHRDHEVLGQGYLAVPATGTTSPAVIVIPERWGIVGHITSVADRFAEAGFVAFAPDLRPGSLTEGPDGTYLMAGPELDEAAQRIAAVADHLASRPEVTAKVGCVGFCAGGTLALWSATRSDRIVAAVGFYPTLPADGTDTDWAEYAGKSALVHRAGTDTGSTSDGVDDLRRAVEAAGGACQTYDYPGTGHAFFNDDRPDVFDQPAAASSWARTLELFRARLG
ncbi:dienelactone hydrolase family protein [Micromonospora sp. NPDC000207]|uniref:dienelactone hydrolase family protein n=1 Tax=Micromonospora sp. NPDC000207 TaxID=3154246 RepID=UPI00331FC198